MALTLRSVAVPGDLASRLEHAIKEFEGILNEEQKREFHNGTPVPTAVDTIAFMAEIGRASDSAWVMQLSPRVTKLLDGVKPFISLVDLVVGGSQNLVASSVWGIIKTGLLSASRSNDFFNSFSEMLLQAGKECPEISAYEQLYSSNAGVVAAVREYLITLIDVCKQAVIFLNKKRIHQKVGSILQPFDSVFTPLKNDLIWRGQTVRANADLAFKQGQEKALIIQETDRKEQSKYRQLQEYFSRSSRREIEKIRLENYQARRNDFLQRCSTYDHRITQRQLRKRGNAAWILTNPKYYLWTISLDSGIFYCFGGLGCGKSVLAAQVVEDLKLKADEVEAVTYFFCRQDEDETLRLNVILGSICRQVAEQIISPNDRSNQELFVEGFMAEFEYCHFLENVLKEKPLRCLWIVLDGVDEAYGSLASDLLVALREMHSQPVKIFWTSRENTFNHGCIQALQGFKGNCKLHRCNIAKVREMHVQEAFIEEELEKMIEMDRLVVSDPDTVDHIRQALSDGAQGMFLWISFQLEAICDQHSDRDIKTCLHRLPPDMPSLYEKIIEQVKKSMVSSKQNWTYCMRALMYMVAARRPLQVADLQTLLGVDSDTLNWKSYNNLNDAKWIVKAFRGLLILDEETDWVQFAHDSVRQYICDPAASIFVDPASAADTFGAMCLTYFHQRYLDGQLTKSASPVMIDPKVFTSSIVEEMSGSSNKLIKKMALQRVRKHRQSPSLMIRLPADFLTQTNFEVSNTNTWSHYVDKYWVEHTDALYTWQEGRVARHTAIDEHCERHILENLGSFIRKALAFDQHVDIEDDTTEDDTLARVKSFEHILLAKNDSIHMSYPATRDRLFNNLAATITSCHFIDCGLSEQFVAATHAADSSKLKSHDRRWKGFEHLAALMNRNLDLWSSSEPSRNDTFKVSADSVVRIALSIFTKYHVFSVLEDTSTPTGYRYFTSHFMWRLDQSRLERDRETNSRYTPHPHAHRNLRRPPDQTAHQWDVSKDVDCVFFRVLFSDTPQPYRSDQTAWIQSAPMSVLSRVFGVSLSGVPLSVWGKRNSAFHRLKLVATDKNYQALLSTHQQGYLDHLLFAILTEDGELWHMLLGSDYTSRRDIFRALLGRNHCTETWPIHPSFSYKRGGKAQPYKDRVVALDPDYLPRPIYWFRAASFLSPDIASPFLSDILDGVRSYADPEFNSAMRDILGNTMLHYAVAGGHHEAISYLRDLDKSGIFEHETNRAGWYARDIDPSYCRCEIVSPT